MLKSQFKALVPICLIAAGMMAFTSLPATAMAGEKLAMRFDVFVKGLQVFEMRYKTELDGGSYSSKVKLEPTGFAGLFVNLKLKMDSSGVLGGKKLTPREYNLRSKKKKKKKKVNVVWGADGLVHTRSSRKLVAYRQKALDKASKPSQPDPLTAMLRAGIANASSPCRYSERVYDGEEVFDLRFRLLKKEHFGPDDGGVYRGPVYKCLLVYHPVAGLSRNKMAQRSANPPAFTVWFAPVASRALGKTMLVPVAATGKLKNKPFVAYANSATLSGKPLNGQSLARK